MLLDNLLKRIVEQGASDGFVTALAPLSIKVDGKLHRVADEPLTVEAARKLVISSMPEAVRESFHDTREANFAISRSDWGRFRVSAFIQRGHCGMVVRRILTDIPTLDSLGLPAVLTDLAESQRGLVILVGGTGTGKSTSLAAMVGHRNRNSSGHIVSIEDPIEYVHEHQSCIVTQREVGTDTESFDIALQNTLRQAPNVVVIGEIRTPEVMSLALQFAETGHLCLCTLHANNANQALDRIQSFFPPAQQNQIWMDLSMNLKAIVAQQLLPRFNQPGRWPIVEVMLNTPLVADLIRKGAVHELKAIMTKYNDNGMQTFDQSLVSAFKQENISEKDAIRFADSHNDVRLMIKMHEQQKSHRPGDSLSGLTYLKN